MNRPIAGQVYERDGKQREVVRVTKLGDNNHEIQPHEEAKVYNVWWKRPNTKTRATPAWCATWETWACKAKVVKELSNERPREC